jgi:hypothetical protein
MEIRPKNRYYGLMMLVSKNNNRQWVTKSTLCIFQRKSTQTQPIWHGDIIE